MRTLMFFLLIFIGNANIYTQTFNDGQKITLQCFKETKPKDRTGGIDRDTPIRRNISFQPVCAYLYNNVITVVFEETLSDISISITNENTGDVVYSIHCNNLDNIPIDLNGKDCGDYNIEIISGEILFEGYFSL